MQQSKQIFYYQNSYRVTIYISHIAYHISEMSIFYADKGDDGPFWKFTYLIL